MFGNYHYILEYVESMMKNYSYLNAGMIINLNGNKIVSRNGLVDLLNDNMNREGLYPIIHLRGDDIEIALTHGMQYGEDYYSFVNGQHTSQGGTHLIAFREAITRTVKEFFKKDFDPSDIRSSIIAAISVKIEEPIFESQTKTKLGSKDMGPNGPSVRNYVVDFIRKNLDDYLHKNGETARILLKKDTGVGEGAQSDKFNSETGPVNGRRRSAFTTESCATAGYITTRMMSASSNQTLFITEGDSASGSITKSRNVETQAVFSLRGKPLNCYGLD